MLHWSTSPFGLFLPLQASSCSHTVLCLHQKSTLLNTSEHPRGVRQSAEPPRQLSWLSGQLRPRGRGFAPAARQGASGDRCQCSGESLGWNEPSCPQQSYDAKSTTLKALMGRIKHGSRSSTKNTGVKVLDCTYQQTLLDHTSTTECS